MNREELIKLLQSWLTTATDDNGNPIHVITEIIKSSLPPAEGAEEISNAILAAAHDYDTKIRNHEEETADSDDYIAFVNGAQWMREFATLHAQRLAEKMVEERLMEELIGYDKFLSNTYWGISHIIKRDEAVDEYLKSRER